MKPLLCHLGKITGLCALWRAFKSSRLGRSAAVNRLFNNHHFLSANKIAMASAAGHLFMLLAAPLLARIYSPQDYAVFGLFMAITGTFGLAVCLRYDQRIATAQNAAEAAHLLVITMLCTLFMVPLVMAGCIYMIQNDILGMGALPYSVLILVFVQLFLTPFSMGLHYWLIRRQDYDGIAAAQFSQATSRPASALTFGLIGVTQFGLITGELAARMAYILATMRSSAVPLLDELRNIKRASLAHHFRVNFKHCAFATPATLIDSAASMIIVPLIALHFGLGMAGLFMFAERLTVGPLNVVSKAFGDVMQGNMRSILEDGDFSRALRYFAKAAAILTVLSAPAALLIWLYGEPFFAFAFGEEWRGAGQLVEMFAPLYVVWLVTRSLSGVQNAVKRLDIHLVFGIVYLTTSIAVFSYSVSEGYDFMQTMAVYVWQNLFVYLFYLALQVYALFTARKRPL